ncbi:MAG: MBL fold metallo-hydrolase [Acutalibacteraceae bacterium]
MQIQEITGGMLPTNCFIVTDEETGISAVIDPGFISDELFDRIKELKKVDAILLTHGHFDHIMGVKTVQDMTGAKIYMHELEKDFATDSRLNLSTVIAERQCDAFVPDVLYHDGDKIQVGNLPFRVLHTRVYHWKQLPDCKDTIFSGDTIFKVLVELTFQPPILQK